MIDLTESTIQHLSAFKHEVESIGEHFMSMNCSIQVECILVAGQIWVDWKLEISHIKSQKKSVLFCAPVELEIGQNFILDFGFVSNWKS